MPSLPRAHFSQLNNEAKTRKIRLQDDEKNISYLFALVKQHDNNFKPKPVSKIVNKDGTPMVVYHGTKSDFTVFDRSKSAKKVHLNVLGDGNYFTVNKEGAARYGENIISAYVKVVNSYIFKNDIYNTVADQIAEEFSIDRSSIKGSQVQAFLKNEGYDGVITVNNSDAVKLVNAFDSNQIKSATDNVGTFDSTKNDIRFSLKEVDRNTEKEYNSSSRKRKQTSYNESETLFMQWKDSKSVSVGDTKAFKRLDKKLHFYKKTNDGCIEITKKDYDAKRILEHEQDYESVERRIDVLSHKYGTVTKRGDSKSNDVYRNPRDDEGNDNSSEGEGLQNEQSRNLERSRGNS